MWCPMHDRKLNEPEELSIVQADAIDESLWFCNEPHEFDIGAVRFCVFRAFDGSLSGFYDRQVNDDREV